MTLLLLLMVALAISFLFSGMEAGLLSVSPVRVRHQAARGDKAAALLEKMLARSQRIFITVLVVTNFMNICALFIGAHLLQQQFGNWGYLVLLLVAFPVFVVLVEALPKSLFRRFPLRLLALFLPLLRISSWLLAPVLALGSIVHRVIPGFGARQRSTVFAAREHFKYLTSLSERHGSLGATERQMIHGVVDFRSVTVADVMTPVAGVISIPPTASVKEVLALSHDKNVDRIPVMGPDGKLVGLVNVFEILVDRAEYRGIGPYVRRIITVPPGEQAYSVIRKLRAARLRMAGVIDRSGIPLGVVTEEAIIAKLVAAAVSDPNASKPAAPAAGESA